MTEQAADDALVLRMYDDASSGRGVQAALLGFAQGFGATVAHLLASDVATQAPVWDMQADLGQGAYAAGAGAYVAHHWRHDPRRRGMGLLQPGGAWRCQQIIESSDVQRSEFFQDFFLPLGLRWTMVGRLSLPPAIGPAHPALQRQQVVDLALVRGTGASGFDAATQQRFERLLPHMSQALAVQQRLADGQAAQLALDHAAHGLLVLNDRLQPVASTAGAEQQIGHRLGSLRFGAAASRRSHARLDQALRDTLVDGQVRHVGLASEDGATERLWITLTRRHSPTGQSPREMWTARGLSAATVRSQLSSLYAKTGTRGQVDFVRLVAMLTQGVAPRAGA